MLAMEAVCLTNHEGQNEAEGLKTSDCLQAWNLILAVQPQASPSSTSRLPWNQNLKMLYPKSVFLPWDSKSPLYLFHF